jgi:hypothetical protein
MATTPEIAAFQQACADIALAWQSLIENEQAARNQIYAQTGVDLIAQHATAQQHMPAK